VLYAKTISIDQPAMRHSVHEICNIKSLITIALVGSHTGMQTIGLNK